MADEVGSRGDLIVKDAASVLSALARLGHQTFARSELAAIVEPFASRIEYFLKTVVFPMANRRTNLYDLVERLSKLSIRSSSIDALHDLRRLYNDSKHDPDAELTFRRCVDVVERVGLALADIAGCDIPTVDAPAAKDLRSRIFVGFWDHYTAGETEVGLYLPSNHWLGTFGPISTFHFQIPVWDQVKPLLEEHPSYASGKEALGETLWTSFSKEGDFLSAGVWEGDVRELLQLLAPFNNATLEEAVLPMLARNNNKLSVGLGIISAAVDVGRGKPTLGGPVLRSAISNRAASDYAVDIEMPYAREMLDHVAALVSELSAEHRSVLSGPAIRREDQSVAAGKPPIHRDQTALVWLM
ncbi:hypothetical protein [Parvularcula oceani]|uniref:hypothetical protein n=1 Tax=Parvularcula oceani TaxID=1247963 RepID=UPI0004E17694|nr:hypothetical protein [Parvularcula oceani]